MKRFNAKIFGEVQGVSFRAFAVREARALGLVGKVQNMPDGSVEIIAEGDADALRTFLAYLKEKHPFARVERVEEKWSEAPNSFSDFRIF